MNENPKILIVDDFETVRLFLRNALNQIGIENIEEAADGREALQMISAAKKSGEQFDLIFCDWNMPEMTGIELLQALNAKDVKIPFGFVTSEGTPEMRTRAADAGAKFLVAKPFSAEDLQAAINGA